MSIKMRHLVVGFLLPFQVCTGLAEEKEGDVRQIDVKLNYRASMIRSNQGNLKTSKRVPPTTGFVEQNIAFVATAKIGKTSFYFNQKLGTTTGNYTQYGWGQQELTDMFTVKAGLGYPQWGGYMLDMWSTEVSSTGVSHYLKYQAPLPNFGQQAIVEVDVKIPNGGSVILQATNDVTRAAPSDPALTQAAATYFDQFNYHTTQQMIPIIAYKGTFGPVTPWVQFFQYNGGHSSHLYVGLRANVEKFTGTFSYINQVRGLLLADRTTRKNKTSVMAAELKYDLPYVTPRFQYQTFKVDENGQTGNFSAGFNDNNESVFTYGIDGNLYGRACMPYFELNMREGKLLADNTKPKGATRNTTVTAFLLGVKGSI